MTHFITAHKKALQTLLAAIFWVAVWQGCSMIVGEQIFVASPLSVAKTLVALLGQKTFYISLLHSFLKIISGFLLATLLGCALAALAYRISAVKTLLSPLFSVIKSVPVASFTILAIIAVGSGNLSFIISFLMVLPVVYTNTLSGFAATDPALLEMATVFRLSRARRLRYIYVPAASPHFLSGIGVALGLCWKSGVAAEVIGLSSNTLGHKLYEAKLYLNTAELFAYTIVIVLVSFAFEKLFTKFAKCALRGLQGGGNVQ